MKTLVLILATLMVSAAEAQMTPLFRANFAASAAPRYGFSSIRDTYLGTAWTLTHMGNIGPGGLPVVDINMRGVTSPTENYVGWFTSLSAHSVPQGAARYVRMKIRLVGPARYQSTASAGSWSTKMVIIGDGGVSNQRFMWNLRSGPSTTEPIFVIEKNIDGGATRISTAPLPMDTWIHAQVKIQSSSTTSSGNARISLYLQDDNRSESTPTYQSGSFSISTADWDQIMGLGYYCDYMRSTGHVQWQYAAFEYDDQFDPNWYSGGGSTPPPTPVPLSAPSGVRVLDVSP